MRKESAVVETDQTPKAESSESPVESSSPPPEHEDERLELARGFLDAKHRTQLGPAWHLYLTLLDRRRPKRGGVWVGGPAGLTNVGILAFTEQTDERTIYRWLARLVKYRYIHIELVNAGRSRDSGIRIRIEKAKWWKAGRMRVAGHPLTKVSGGPLTEVSGVNPAKRRGA